MRGLRCARGGRRPRAAPQAELAAPRRQARGSAPGERAAGCPRGVSLAALKRVQDVARGAPPRAALRARPPGGAPCAPGCHGAPLAARRGARRPGARPPAHLAFPRCRSRRARTCTRLLGASRGEAGRSSPRLAAARPLARQRGPLAWRLGAENAQGAPGAPAGALKRNERLKLNARRVPLPQLRAPRVPEERARASCCPGGSTPRMRRPAVVQDPLECVRAPPWRPSCFACLPNGLVALQGPRNEYRAVTPLWCDRG